MPTKKIKKGDTLQLTLGRGRYLEIEVEEKRIRIHGINDCVGIMPESDKSIYVGLVNPKGSKDA